MLIDRMLRATPPIIEPVSGAEKKAKKKAAKKAALKLQEDLKKGLKFHACHVPGQFVDSNEQPDQLSATIAMPLNFLLPRTMIQMDQSSFQCQTH
jgi:hypothetical protein